MKKPGTARKYLYVLELVLLVSFGGRQPGACKLYRLPSQGPL